MTSTTTTTTAGGGGTGASARSSVWAAPTFTALACLFFTIVGMVGTLAGSSVVTYAGLSAAVVSGWAALLSGLAALGGDYANRLRFTTQRLVGPADDDSIHDPR